MCRSRLSQSTGGIGKMKDASTFDARQCFIRLPLNIWWKSVGPCGADRAWITAGDNLSRLALGPASSLEHLDKVHASPKLRVSFSRRHGTPRFLRRANRQHNPSVGFVSGDEVPVGQALLSPAFLGAPGLIRLPFWPIRLGERESWLRKSGELARSLSSLVV
jgi:hypothetical protein